MKQSESWKIDTAVNVALAVMASASTDVISPKRWWERCKSAMEAAADSAETWPEFCSRMAAKLQIETFTAASTCNLEIAKGTIGDDVDDFFSTIRSDAIYIVALAQMKRAEERETIKKNRRGE